MRRVTLLIILCITVLNLVFVLLPLHATPLPNRYSGELSVASYTLGNADILFPLLGDSGHTFYLNPTLEFGSDYQGYADLGLGYRWPAKQSLYYWILSFWWIQSWES
ncbi:hypothetical protein [Rickettsiella massiliensis]|uniref:hypothetical protein n=1 Tax=Rickettsiella massiliensis TaxID=676517 RepID=UPI00029A8410|nr:hypothetical protein [Rickettsiella massiliensis]